VSEHANLPLQSLQFPLIHPNFVLPDQEADRYIASEQLAPTFAKRQLRKLRKLFK
jgi:hypothetical protein